MPLGVKVLQERQVLKALAPTSNIADNSGNVSWLFFTTRSHELAAFRIVPGEPGNYTFLNDPEACPWACTIGSKNMLME